MTEERALLVLKMIGSPIRLSILNLLTKDKTGICVSGIEEQLGLSQSSVSQHLAHLRNSGILKCEKKGKKVCYRIIDKKVIEIMNCLDVEE